MSGHWQGHYLDGRSPQRHDAAITLVTTGLEITTSDGTTRRWPFVQIRQTQGAYRGEPVRLERGGEPAEALIVDDVAFLSALREIAPEFTTRFHDPRRRRRRTRLTVAAGLVSVAIVAVLYRWGIPAAAGAATTFVPVAWEERLGNEVLARAVGPEQRCQDLERQRVVDAILARLTTAAPSSPYRLRVTVVDRPEINAFALPGGQIVILRGLLDVTDTPEMLAGVLAHEAQHVIQRHTTRSLLQHASTGLLVAAVTGDVSGVLTAGLESARVVGALHYSRRHEGEADREGMRMLLGARIDPRGMIAFFEAMLREGERARASSGFWQRYLSSHPTTEERLVALRALAAGATGSPIALLPGYDWKDVRRICGER